MKALRPLAPLCLVAAVVIALSACRTSDDEDFNFDAAAHQRATELRSRALALMANSGAAYSQHRADAETLAADLENAYQLSAATPDNELVAAEWAAMKDPERDLYGGFVRRWQVGGAIDEAARDPWMNRVTIRFNYILCLEAAKKTKGGRCTPPASEATAAPPTQE